MPKKPVRNAFYFYMKDLEPDLKREGRVFPNGMQDIVPIAHPRWKALPESEKTRYEKIAKEYKAKMRGVEGDKYRMDNVGNILAHRVDPMAEADKQRLKERASVKSKWPAGSEVTNEVFYLINFQTLCKTEEGDYLPAEIGVVEYSIAKGITKTLHRFIEPGRIPLGYSFECRQKSEDYHKIPEQNFEHSDANYRGLWIQLENFVNPNGEKPEYPPLYSLGNDIEEVAYCLGWIHSRACLGIPNRLKKVYELEGMVADLYAHKGTMISKSSVIDMLTTSTWDYEPKTRCFYHEELECKYCALAIVKRYTYAISDSMCSMFELPLTENHLPAKTESRCNVLPPSSMTVEHKQARRAAAQQQNSRGRAGQGRWGGGQTGMVTQQIVKSATSTGGNSDDDSDDDDDDEVDYTSLRRPNAPVERAPEPTLGWSGMPLRSNIPPAVSSNADFPALGRGGPVAGMPTSGIPMGRGYTPTPGDFPAMGRTNPVSAVGIGRGQPQQQGVQTTKFAGRAGAPAPSNAPIPPSAWVQDPNRQTMAGVAQVLRNPSDIPGFPSGQINTSIPPPSLNSSMNCNSEQFDSSVVPPSLNSSMMSITGPFDVSVPPPSLNSSFQTTNGTVDTSIPPPSLNHSRASTNSAPFMMNAAVGRGRGLLGNIDPNVKMPKGRGYAPPGMDVGVRGSKEQEETGVPGEKPPAEAWVGDHLPSHIRPFAESEIRSRDLRGEKRARYHCANPAG
ncbi:hypothetical protein FSP39_010906 [Pinctada imbricata]|uniref:HMG box domain-containing protein n=1 Tax=Pinctada imbricata TaxID=66713 RepID=A0AA88YW09_PINIB|nr:hypothetical protein FSP39_010906 [Pinctada imbricata]